MPPSYSPHSIGLPNTTKEFSSTWYISKFKSSTYLCLIRLSGHTSNRFDGLSLWKGLLPSESDRISEDFHFNVVNVGLDLVGDVPTIVVHNSISITLKIFLLTLIMSFLLLRVLRFESLIGCLS